jgi:hypothetical protein
MDRILKKITDEVWMDMLNPQVDKIAEKITKSIFDVGNERGLNMKKHILDVSDVQFDVREDGVYLCLDRVEIRVSDDVESFDDFCDLVVEQLGLIKTELKKYYND